MHKFLCICNAVCVHVGYNCTQFVKACTVWEFAWVDSALVFLDECLSYEVGGCLNRFVYCS